MPKTLQIFDSMSTWQNKRTRLGNIRLGFVPTMGVLHEGHASLMQMSLKENDMTVVSIFVNQTQFNQQQDFALYPRTLDADFRLLEQTGVDICLTPNHSAIYPDGYRFKVIDSADVPCIESHYRPGHFTGVLTVVMKLLHLVRPTHLYLGEKDYHQYQFIRDMSSAFLLDTLVKPCPTIREPSGLPFSSRNQRLTDSQRIRAEQFARIFHQSISLQQIRQELSAIDVRVEYLEEHEGRRFVAVYVDDIRLIDNYERDSIPKIV